MAARITNCDNHLNCIERINDVMATEDRIDALCRELKKNPDPEQATSVAADLRTAIREHVQEVRHRAWSSARFRLAIRKLFRHRDPVPATSIRPEDRNTAPGLVSDHDKAA